MVDINGQSFSYYLLPEDTRRSLSKARVNNSNDKGDVGTSFGEFFATKTEELGRLGDGSDTRPRVSVAIHLLARCGCRKIKFSMRIFSGQTTKQLLLFC